MLGMIIGTIAGLRYDYGQLAEKDFVLLRNEDDYASEACMSMESVMPVINVIRSTIDKAPSRQVDDEVYTKLEEFGRSTNENAARISSLMKRNYRKKLCGGRGHSSYDNGFRAAWVSPVAWLYDSPSKVRRAARTAGRVYAQYNEDIVAAELLSVAAFLARTGSSKDAIRTYIQKQFGCSFPKPVVDTFETKYTLAGSMDSVVQAMAVFFEANSFEESIRLSEYCGGTRGTRSALVGAISEAYYGIPDELRAKCMSLLTDNTKRQVNAFDAIRKPQIARRQA